MASSRDSPSVAKAAVLSIFGKLVEDTHGDGETAVGGHVCLLSPAIDDPEGRVLTATRSTGR
jgi:hypothetical protein